MSSTKWRLFRLGLNELSVWVKSAIGKPLPITTKRKQNVRTML